MGLITTLVCYVLVIVIFLLLCALVAYSAYLHYIHMMYSHLPGPKRTSFYLGNMGVHLQDFDNGRQYPDRLLAWQKEFGYVYHTFVLHIPSVMVFRQDFVKTLLLNTDHPKADMWYKSFHSLYGVRFVESGLLTQLNHETWMKHRRIMNPAFNRKYLAGVIDQFNFSADIFIDKLSNLADGSTVVNMLDELNRFTLYAIGKVAFGLELDVIDNPESKINEDIRQCLKGVERQSVKPQDAIKPFHAESTFRESVRESVRNLRHIGEECITDRLQTLHSGSEEHTRLPKDMLTYILQMFNDEDGGDIKIDEMVDQLITFFIAGQETTGNLLSFTVMLLSTHPEVLHRLRTEVDAVIGDKEAVEYEDICKMEYCMLVLKEALRMFPPAHSTLRRTAYELECCGYKIPANSNVIVSTYVMGRMEEYFENPLQFDPTRFSNTDGRHTFTSFPFSLGARNCIGQQFALIESRLLLAKFVRRFNFELLPGQTFDILVQVTVKPKDQCKGYLTLVN